MADGVFNYAKGRVVEKIADSAAAIGVLLFKANEAEATLIDRTDIAALKGAAGNTEADFTNYAPKTALTGTITVDTGSDLVDVSIPDQTWTAAGGGVNNTLTKLITYYEESAADAGRIPLTHHDFAETTTGSDIQANFNAAGFFRAQ